MSEDSDYESPADKRAVRRLAALATVCESLGNAIRGAAEIKSEAIVAKLSEQLVMNAKRASWVEKQLDPDWEPMDTTGAKRRTGSK